MSTIRRPTQTGDLAREKEFKDGAAECGDIRGRSGVDGGTTEGIGGGNGDGNGLSEGEGSPDERTTGKENGRK